MNFPKSQFKILIGTLIFISLYGSAIVFATSLVAPGSTLNPNLGPGSVSVYPPVSYGSLVTTGHNGEILYNDASGNLASDSNFTRLGTPIVDPTGVYIIANNNNASIQNTADNNTLVIAQINNLSVDDNYNHTKAVGSLLGQVTHEGTGTLSNSIGMAGQIVNNNNGSITDAGAVLGRIQNSGTGIITDATAFKAQFKEANPGTITNSYVLKADNLDGTNKYGVYIDVPGSKNILHEIDLQADSPLKWYDSDSSNFVAFRSPSLVSSDVTWVLPSTDGTSGQFLKTDGSGNLSWDTPVGGGGGGVVQTTKVTLSSAQILTLNSSPVELVPAPGSGKYLHLLGAAVKLHFGTTSYSQDQIDIRYPGVDQNNPRAYNGYVLGSSHDVLQGFTLNYSNNLDIDTIGENQPLNLVAPYGTPTGGDGTLDIYVTYEIIDL